jgi:regulator of protease activity HflC (stomatin/prohibitin superfamily)
VEAFLAFIWRFILELWPWTIVDRWELGLRVRAGKHLTRLGPGIRVSLPFIDVILTEPSTLQTTNLTDQTVITVDSVNASVGGVIYYHVEDLKQLWLMVHDHEEALSNLALTALAGQLAARKFEDCDIAEMQLATQQKIRDTAEGWGIHINGFELTDLCKSQVVRLMASEGNQTLVLGSEE